MADRTTIIASLKYFSPINDPKIDWEKVDLDSIVLLDHARDIAGVPFQITRSYSTPAHSVAVGGFATDAHTEIPCTAFDILCTHADGTFSTQAAYKIIGALFEVGFSRIGVNVKNGHVHADNSPKLPQEVFWIE